MPTAPALVLVTGALGNLGQTTIAALRAEGHRVRALDLPTSRAKRAARALPSDVEVVFGDVTSDDDVRTAVRGVDAIIHLAAVLPPASERMPELAREVNVGGTRRLVEAAEAEGRTVRFVYASSFSIYGPNAATDGLVTAQTPVVATDVYTETKIACEALLQRSKLDWVILRIGASIEGTALAADPIVIRLMFEIDPAHPIELVHGKDVALAAARAVSAADASKKVLPIGGGPRCQLRQREVLAFTERMLGTGPLPERAFGKEPNYTCWLDTQESQRLLDFQHHTAEDIERDLGRRLRWLSPLLFLARPIVRRYLLAQSGPYRGAPPRPTWQSQMDAAARAR